MKKVALLTSKNLESFVSDDELLLSDLQKIRGYQFEFRAWDLPVPWNEYHAAIVRTTWDYTDRLEEFLQVLGQINSSSCRLINSLETIQWNCRKTYLRDLQKQGKAILPSLFGEDLAGEASRKIIESWPGDQLVVKPLVGATSREIKVITKSEFFAELNRESENFFNKPLSYWFFQPFAEEIIDGELSFVFFGNEFSHAIRKTPKPGEFRSQEEFGSTIKKYLPSEDEVLHAQSMFSEVKDSLLFARVDLLAFQSKLCLVELELIEPALYFRMSETSPNLFCKHLQVFLNRI